ncbi:MAG: hypothetical protein ABSC04_18215 [Syntrophobacteraceae bacterium]|jgi:hypothetical protein
MSFFKMLFAFAPWVSFLIIARDSLFRLKLGLVVALVLVVVMGITRLHRGVILWAGLFFFTYATVAVVLFNNMWIAQHMGVMANGALAVSTWLTIAIRKPFTLDYAREHTDPSLWDHPLFIRTNFVIASVWGLAFSVSAILAWGKIEHFILSELGYEVITYTLLIGTLAFSTWYPNYVRRTRELEERVLATQQIE